MSFSFRPRRSQNKQQALTKQQNTPPILVVLPLNPMLALVQGSDEPHATGAGSTAVKHLAIANTQCDREPQEAIDISIIRNIDLM